MRAVLKLEKIGDDYFQHGRHVWDFQTQLRYMRRLGQDKSPSWVARLTLQNGVIQREFLRGTRDYSEANSVGSRGIFEYYPLTDGVYEVNDRYHWKRVRRYFIQVADGVIHEITPGEAYRILQEAAHAGNSL